MSNTIPQTHLVAWRAFLTAHAKIIPRIEADLDAAKVLPLTWYDVLLPLAEAPDHRLRMYELADAMVLNRSSLTRLVDRLEAAGLLVRQPTPTDRRGAWAVLTDAGRAALATTWPVYAEAITAYFACYLTDTDAAILAALFTRMATQQAADCAPPQKLPLGEN